ncbi:Hypothetical predicted protein, partial [Drosophila guanche]
TPPAEVATTPAAQTAAPPQPAPPAAETPGPAATPEPRSSTETVPPRTYIFDPAPEPEPDSDEMEDDGDEAWTDDSVNGVEAYRRTLRYHLDNLVSWQGYN